MTLSLVLLCIAAAALVAFGTSALSGLGLAAFGRQLAARSPAAQARVLLALAVLPLAASTAVMTAALAPSLGFIADHCLSGVDLHGHPHICGHHEEVFPALPILFFAGLLVLRCVTVGLRHVVLGISAHGIRRALVRRTGGATAFGAHLLPFEEPQAFVVGVLRPVLFVTRGLLAIDRGAHLDAVLAHERAHVLRADALRRVVAGLSFAFHLPGIASAIEQRLARAHEMAADEDAATAIGSRAQVARALVHLARARVRAPRAALAFVGSEVEIRVRALLETEPRPTGPMPRTLAIFATVALLAIAGGAEAVHHAVEVVLGFVGG
jgi:Zn-dependent protease with chaperone function